MCAPAPPAASCGRWTPGTQKPDRNRGVALWGDYVISVTGLDGRVIATDKETGKVVWDKNLLDQPDLEITAAPLALKDAVIVGASGGDNGVRDWIASLDPKTGEVQWKTFVIPAPGEPGSETWKDKNNAWRTGGGAMYVTGSFDPSTNLTYWGTGNPVPRYNSGFRPGDNLFTNSTVAFDAKSGKMQWHFQHTANDIHDYDTSGSQIIVDGKVNGDDRKLVVHADRNGFNYTFDRLNGQFLKAVQYAEKVNWTKGIDPKTGKPVDYDAGKDVQTYNHDWKSVTDTIKNSCPTCTAAPTSGRPRSATRRGCSTSARAKAAPTSRPIRRRMCAASTAAAVTSTTSASSAASPWSTR